MNDNLIKTDSGADDRNLSAVEAEEKSSASNCTICEDDKTLIVPSSLRYILREEFSNSDVERVVIPENVLVIFPGAFEWCKRLKEVVFLNPETVVLNEAFKGCFNLDVKSICRP